METNLGTFSHLDYVFVKMQNPTNSIFLTVYLFLIVIGYQLFHVSNF